MLKPKKRKARTQVAMRGHEFVVYVPHAKARVVSNDEVRERMMIGWVIGRPHSKPHLSRQIRLIAQRRFSKGTIGIVGLHPMSKKDWDFHWQWKAMMRLVEDNQLEQPQLRGVVDPLNELWQPKFLSDMPYLSRMMDLTHHVIGTDPGRLEGDAGVTVLKGRVPGLFSHSLARTFASSGKSDWQLHQAMKVGPEAVKQLLEARLANMPDIEALPNPKTRVTMRDLPEGRLQMKKEFAFPDPTREQGGFSLTLGGNAPIGVQLRQPHFYLINEEVRNVDPYASDLTAEQKAAIIEEAKNNPVYFKSILKKPAPDGSRTTPFTDAEKQEIMLRHEYDQKSHVPDTTTKHYFDTIPSDEVFAFPGRGMTPFTPKYDPDHLNLPLGTKLEDE